MEVGRSLSQSSLAFMPLSMLDLINPSRMPLDA